MFETEFGRLNGYGMCIGSLRDDSAPHTMTNVRKPCPIEQVWIGPLTLARVEAAECKQNLTSLAPKCCFIPA
jgi:hypothetical protein